MLFWECLASFTISLQKDMSSRHGQVNEIGCVVCAEKQIVQTRTCLFGNREGYKKLEATEIAMKSEEHGLGNKMQKSKINKWQSALKDTLN